ncbi:MAG: hypothetical protein KAS65_04545 [Candidatus Aminicenantes bacterium]|nr:hypothetical protein [Candidatus Aminicenantes bacterium]
MKKTILMILLLFIAQPFLKSELLTVFKNLTKPGHLHIKDDRIYIVQESNIFVYNLKDYKLLGQMGKEGEGPGELNKSVFYVNKVIKVKDGILFEGYNKIIKYSKNGEFVWQKRKNSSLNQTLPIGDKFVVRRVRVDTKTKILLICISLYSKDLKPLKDLYCIKHFQQGGPDSALKMNMLLDIPVFKVWENKIYVEKSAKEFLIDVFDQKGEIISSIKHAYENLKLNQNHKKQIIERYKKDVLIKREGGWEMWSKRNKTVYPKIFPAIQNFEIIDNKIYVQTYLQKDGMDEYWILDLEGKLMKKIYLPSFKPGSLLDSILGTKLNCIYQNRLYYLEENEEEEWGMYGILIEENTD